MKRYAYLATIIFAGACLSTLAMAQPHEQSSDLEPSSYVLDQLDAIYGASDKNRVDAENLLNTEQKSNAQGLQKKTLPSTGRPRIETEIITKSQPYKRSEISTHIITKTAPYDPVQAPLPRRRPATFNASESFIAQARSSFGIKTKAPQRQQTAKTNKRSKISIRQAIVQPTNPLPPRPTNDPLGKTLINPSVTDILAQIEPAAGNAKIDFAPAPKAKPVKTKPFKSTRDNTISLGYEPAITALPESIKPSLKEKILNKLTGANATKLDILVYADDTANNTAGKIALKRAEELKSFLVSKGVDEALITLRPLGNSVKITPQDRVDIRFIK